MQSLAKSSWRKHIDFMIIDTIVLCLAFWFSYYVVFGTPTFWLVTDWLRYLGFIVTLNIVIMLITNPFSGVLRRPYYMEIVRAFQLTVTNALTATFAFYFLKVGALYSRGTSFYMYGIFFVFSALFNALWKRLLLSGTIVVKTTARLPLFVIGDTFSIAETVLNVGKGDFVPYDIVGIHLVDGEENVNKEALPKDIPILGTDFYTYILQENIKEVLVAVAPDRVEKGVIQALHDNAINVNIIMESTLGFVPEDQYLHNVGVYPTLSVGSFSFKSNQLAYLAFKRVMDLVFSVLGLLVLVPLSLLVKIAFLASGDHGKIFYRHKRVGQDGKPIRIWKFRSMVSDADKALEDLLKDDTRRKEWNESQKFEHDPRVTKVGDFLRRTSIDEVPQLLNVLAGDMSLVGPRPLVRGELEKFGGLKLYQRVKPGITGWWACNGRSNIDYRERLELEYYYVKNCSLYLDVLCVLRTILVVFRRDGAR